VLENEESDFGILIKTMDEKTTQIIKALMDLAASTQSDLAATYMLIADHLPNLDESQRIQLREDSQLRLKNAQQLRTTALNL
jgi:hypothetical protein